MVTWSFYRGSPRRGKSGPTFCTKAAALYTRQYTIQYLQVGWESSLIRADFGECTVYIKGYIVYSIAAQYYTGPVSELVLRKSYIFRVIAALCSDILNFYF